MVPSGDNNPIHAYIKPANDVILCPATGNTVDNRAVQAEAIGYALASAMGFSVPPTAGVIVLEKNQLPADILRAIRSMPGADSQEDYLCWFSQDASQNSLKQRVLDTTLPENILKKRLKGIADDLLKDPDTPRVIAFDDWLANSDRNLGNLLSAPDGMALIDHERIFDYPNWTPGALGSSGAPTSNKILTFLDSNHHGFSAALPRQSARAMAYSSFKARFSSVGSSAVLSSLERLLPKEDIDAILGLIGSRLNPEKYHKAIGLLA